MAYPMTTFAEKLSVPKNYLMLIAGLVWTFAGLMVAAIGLPLLASLGGAMWWLYPMSAAIFLVFYLFIFSTLVAKHAERIRAAYAEKLPVWQFFDASSYLVMAVMMTGGMVLRVFHLIPDWSIAFFYSGLGIALFACGLRFLTVFARKDVLASVPSGQDPQRASV